MATRAELRSAVRRRLEDTGASPLWDDAALNDFLAEAVRRYGTRFPQERSATVTVSAGATSVAVSPPLEGSRVVRVFDEAGRLVPRQRASERNDAPAAQAWRWWGSTLVLARPAATTGDWQIDYLGGRTLPDDDVTPVDVVPGDEDIIVLLAGASALRRRAVEDSKRGLGRGADAVAAAAAAFQREADRLISARRRRARGGWLTP